MKPLRFAALIGVAALLMAPSAVTSRPARPLERANLIRVTTIYVDTSDCCAVITRIKISSVRVSTVDPRWATVALFGYNQKHENVGKVFAVLHKGNLTGRWSVRAFGTDALGCDMPLRVRRDLGEDCF
jgi:hypothetical protein